MDDTDFLILINLEIFSWYMFLNTLKDDKKESLEEKEMLILTTTLFCFLFFFLLKKHTLLSFIIFIYQLFKLKWTTKLLKNKKIFIYLYRIVIKAIVFISMIDTIIIFSIFITYLISFL